MKKFICIIFLTAFLAGCTSRQYVVKTTEDIASNKRTEVICTHKKALIPWYAGVAAGVVSFNYGKECTERVSELSDPPFVAEEVVAKEGEAKP